MTQLPGNEAVERFIENEERLDKFLNTDAGYVTNEAIPRTIEGIPYVMEILLARLGRQTKTHVTSLISTNSVEEYEEEITNVSTLLKFTTDYPAWIRVYGKESDMIADRTRLSTQDPVNNDMCYIDIFTTEDLTVYSNPIVIFNNLDNPVENTAYISVKNLDTVDREISVSIDFIGGAI